MTSVSRLGSRLAVVAIATMALAHTGLAAPLPPDHEKVPTPHSLATKLFARHCVECHSVDGKGGTKGPTLDGVGSRYDRPGLERWLEAPSELKPGTHMPTVKLTPAQRRILVDWLVTLQ